jgi:hypothetical protein
MAKTPDATLRERAAALGLYGLLARGRRRPGSPLQGAVAGDLSRPRASSVRHRHQPHAAALGRYSPQHQAAASFLNRPALKHMLHLRARRRVRRALADQATVSPSDAVAGDDRVAQLVAHQQLRPPDVGTALSAPYDHLSRTTTI